MAGELTAKVRVDGDAAGLAQAAAAGEKSLDGIAGAAGRTSRAAAGVDAAFAALNIRSAGQIQAEINAINNALTTLARSANVSGADFDRAFATGQQKIAALKAELAGTDGHATKAGTAIAGVGDSLRGLAAPLAGLALGQKFIESNVAAESLQRTLTLLTGSGEAAAAEIEYLRAAANRMGIDVEAAGRAYINLAAASKGTALEGQATRDIFEAVAGAMSKLGKSSADTEGALQAVAQMMSKGTVSMEEMRQQLGERLPGAMQAAADASGVTVAELGAMIESGQVLAADLLPKLAEGLKKVYGTDTQADGFAASWARMKNAVSETFTFIGDSGVMVALTASLEVAGTALRGLTGAFELLGKTIGITLAGLATFDLTRPIESFKAWKQAVAEAGAEIEARLGRVAPAVAQAEAAQAQLAASGAAAARAAEGQAPAWLAVVNAYAKVGAAAKEMTEQAVKSVAARAEEGKATMALADAFGTETDKREAAIGVAEDNAVALRQLAEARRIEAEVAASNVIALEESAAAEGKVTEEKRKAIDAASNTAKAKALEAEKSEAAARAAERHTVALATETEAARDNAARVGELRAAWEAATATLEQLRASKERGIATDREVAQAETAAAAAGKLYRDAVADQTAALEAQMKIRSSEQTLKGKSIQLEIEHTRTLAEVAKAYGDESTAAAYMLQVKRLEIQLAELNATAKREEARSQLLVIESKREEAIASGTLTTAKSAELNAQKLAAEAKMFEAEIAATTAERMRQLMVATADAAAVADGSAGNYDKLAGSLDGVAEAAGRASTGVRSMQGASSSPGVASAASPVNFSEALYQRGATVEEKKIADKYVAELFAREAATTLTGNLLTAAGAARLQTQAINAAVDKAIALAREELATGKAVDLGTSVNDLTARNLATLNRANLLTESAGFNALTGAIRSAGLAAKAQPATGADVIIRTVGNSKFGTGAPTAVPVETHKVDITINNGQTTAINTASAADAAALIAALRELQGRAA